MASIATNESSPTVLESPRPDPANRFFGAEPDYDHVGPIKTTMVGTIHAFTFREDYTIALTIKHLTPTQAGGDALVMKKWLMTGGSVNVTTDDVNGHTYSGVTLMPGTKPEIKLDDEARQHYSFSCVLRDDSAIVVNYRD